jgi:F-type H+-transporting ATPase subunit epsilon
MYHLQVLTPEEIFFDDEVISIIAPGEQGYLGVMTDHAPLITSLKEGIFIITDKNMKKNYFDVSKGFMEINYSKVSVIVESIKPREPIDIGVSGGI